MIRCTVEIKERMSFEDKILKIWTKSNANQYRKDGEHINWILLGCLYE